MSTVYRSDDSPERILNKIMEFCDGFDYKHRVFKKRNDKQWNRIALKIIKKMHTIYEGGKKKYQKPSHEYNKSSQCFPSFIKKFFDDKMSDIFDQFASNKYFEESHFQLFCLVFLLNGQYVNSDSIRLEMRETRVKYLDNKENKTDEGFIDIFYEYKSKTYQKTFRYKIELKIILTKDYVQNQDNTITIKKSSHQKKLKYPIGGGIVDIQRQALLQARSYEYPDAMSASLILLLRKKDSEIFSNESYINLPNLKESPNIDKLNNDDLKHAYNNDFIKSYMEKCKSEVSERIINLTNEIRPLVTMLQSYDNLKLQYEDQMTKVNSLENIDTQSSSEIIALREQESKIHSYQRDYIDKDTEYSQTKTQNDILNLIEQLRIMVTKLKSNDNSNHPKKDKTKVISNESSNIKSFSLKEGEVNLLSSENSVKPPNLKESPNIDKLSDDILKYSHKNENHQQKERQDYQKKSNNNKQMKK